ncbi:amidase [Ancylobacter lacus]|uniref:amidase n=1 Tax=Ancylobacter lacus TaxID=2579970 RepID=UPI001BCF7BD2|nr:amidase [Ancylobacter lacus]MBS7538249.1 amidase [Ancylobacter lacus]
MTDHPPVPFLSAGALVNAYASGRLRPEAVVEQHIERIARLDPVLNAFIHVAAADAREDAARSAARWRAGAPLGPLDGVPVAVKDLIDVAGQPTSFATGAVPPVVAAQDAALVAWLRETGAILIGKTNLLEFAYGVAHPAFGQTNNPFDPARTSGGSSGGSAAAVAAGLATLAVGTDTGGSIRAPAAYCGIVGLKPSFGLVPLEGVFPLAASLDHAGPLARSVEDARLLLSVLAGRAMPAPDIDLAGVRVGVLAAHVEHPAVTPGVQRAFDAAVARLAGRCARIGDVVIEGIADCNAELMTVLLPEATGVHRGLGGAAIDGYAEGTRRQIEAGEAVPALAYLDAQRMRRSLRAAVDRLLEEVDVVVSPTVPFVAPAGDPDMMADEGEHEMLALGLGNMTGHPVVTIPCGLSEGLPVGLQLLGRRDRDAELLAIAAGVERVLGFAARPAL